MSNSESKVRSTINFHMEQDKDNKELVDVKLEVCNFTLEQLRNLLHSLTNSLTPPDEAT